MAMIKTFRNKNSPMLQQKVRSLPFRPTAVSIPVEDAVVNSLVLFQRNSWNITAYVFVSRCKQQEFASHTTPQTKSTSCWIRGTWVRKNAPNYAAIEKLLSASKHAIVILAVNDKVLVSWFTAFASRNAVLSPAFPWRNMRRVRYGAQQRMCSVQLYFK